MAACSSLTLSTPTPRQPMIEALPCDPRSAASAGYTALTPQQLKARAIIAGDLYREGRIERTECFRLEVDSAVGRDSGPVKFKENRDYAEWLEENS